MDDIETKQECNFWIPELNLFQSDKEILLSDQWLNDNIICAAQTLLKRQSKMHGWMSTQLCKSVFQPIPPRSPFVQILHINGSHWITVSNSSFSCGPTSSFTDCVKIYDSGSPSSISVEIQNMVCSMMKPKSSMLTFEIVNVQSQSNSYDCGVFAIAFATEIAHGNNPVSMHFDDMVMRRHLMECFKACHMSSFPCRRQRRIPFGSRVKFYIQQPIYCTCRTVNNIKRPMILCDFCKNWFHLECENVQEGDVAVQKQNKWKCSQCKKNFYPEC